MALEAVGSSPISRPNSKQCAGCLLTAGILFLSWHPMGRTIEEAIRLESCLNTLTTAAERCRVHRVGMKMPSAFLKESRMKPFAYCACGVVTVGFTAKG